MPLGVSYMGTKRQLARHVAAHAASAKQGPLLDLFAGMCAVATEVGRSRQVWTNDLQHFAATVADAHFCSFELPPAQADALACAYPLYAAHLAELTRRRRTGSSSDRYDLFTTTYADSYFGEQQCMEIDAIRRSIDLTTRHESDKHRWLLLALCRAASRCSTSTGHFAQPLRRKANNAAKFDYQRGRSIWKEWGIALLDLNPVGSRDWRSKNRAYKEEALTLLEKLKKNRDRPAVIYADPPYTKDQYSRYYHLYETIILYDYPTVSGSGLYRPDRIASDFSLSTRVAKALESLIAGAAALDSELILSYPTNGLLGGSRDVIPLMMDKTYGRRPHVQEISHQHSTMGASKGAATESVVEVIYRAVP